MKNEWGEEECIHVIGKKKEGKRPLGRPKRKRVDNIKMGFGERWWRGMAWIDVTG
jgi:hypothetical protein